MIVHCEIKNSWIAKLLQDFLKKKAARLAELVKDNQGNLFPGKKAFKNAAQTVERTWQEIKNTLDTEFAEEHHHTKEQIQAKFHNMKMKTKENVAAQNKYMSQTGGGPPSSSSGAESTGDLQRQVLEKELKTLTSKAMF
uniref:Regulatory protein zeste n=1 Tax=Ditylenchus dipsaci TaxID=166011 RepID=A0A915EKA5_9BILA